MEAFLKNPTDFWPRNGRPLKQNVEATVRFIVYSSIVAFVLTKNTKVLLLGFLVLASIYLYFKVNPTPGTVSDQDPMNNFSDRVYNSEKVNSYMAEVFPDDTRNAQRGFFTMPDMDLEPFLRMQGRGQPFCRDDQWACTAEGNTHFPEESTIRAQYPFSGQLKSV